MWKWWTKWSLIVFKIICVMPEWLCFNICWKIFVKRKKLNQKRKGITSIDQTILRAPGVSCFQEGNVMTLNRYAFHWPYIEHQQWMKKEQNGRKESPECSGKPLRLFNLLTSNSAAAPQLINANQSFGDQFSFITVPCSVLSWLLPPLFQSTVHTVTSSLPIPEVGSFHSVFIWLTMVHFTSPHFLHSEEPLTAFPPITINNSTVKYVLSWVLKQTSFPT